MKFNKSSFLLIYLFLVVNIVVEIPRFFSWFHQKIIHNFKIMGICSFGNFSDQEKTLIYLHSIFNFDNVTSVFKIFCFINVVFENYGLLFCEL